MNQKSNFTLFASIVLAFIIAGLAPRAAHSALRPIKKPWTFNPADLTPAEMRDYQRWPHMMRFVKTVPAVADQAVPKGDQKFVKAKLVFRPPESMWDGFFKAAVADHLTNIRAFALISRELKERGLTVYGPGKDFETAVHKNNINMGLAIPAKHIALGFWAPDPSVKNPEFLVHLTVIYKQRFIHRFPDAVLPANLKVGYGPQTDYYLNGKKHHGYLLTADLYDGPHGCGFKNVHGVGGQKRGLLGFFQKILFFLPDAVHSMMITPKGDKMITEALINTTINHFESRAVYQIHYNN